MHVLLVILIFLHAMVGSNVYFIMEITTLIVLEFENEDIVCDCDCCELYLGK